MDTKDIMDGDDAVTLTCRHGRLEDIVTINFSSDNITFDRYGEGLINSFDREGTGRFYRTPLIKPVGFTRIFSIGNVLIQELRNILSRRAIG